MKRLQVSSDIVGMSSFRANLRFYLDAVKVERRPIVVAVDGEPFAILVPPEEFDEFLDYKEFKKLNKAAKKAV